MCRPFHVPIVRMWQFHECPAVDDTNCMMNFTVLEVGSSNELREHVVGM